MERIRLQENQLENIQITDKKSLSEILYGIRWEKYFPQFIAENSVTIRLSEYEEVSQFLRANYDRIFENDPSQQKFYTRDSIERKRNYYEHCGDFFAFSVGDEVIATFIGNPIDWGSYYLRSMAIKPDFQSSGIFQKFLEHLFDILRIHGVDRVEGDVSSANLISAHIFNKMMFNITGFSTSERWGALTLFTKFLNSNCEKTYLDIFCSGIRPQVRTPEGST